MKQHLAAIRMLFDWLVVGHVMDVNPASSVRGPKYVVKRGKTPVLTADQARTLLDSIETDTIVGLRDRALIGLMVFSFARVSATIHMRVEDYYQNGKRWWFRLAREGRQAPRCPRPPQRRGVHGRIPCRRPRSGTKRKVPCSGASTGAEHLRATPWRAPTCCG